MEHFPRQIIWRECLWYLSISAHLNPAPGCVRALGGPSGAPRDLTAPETSLSLGRSGQDEESVCSPAHQWTLSLLVCVSSSAVWGTSFPSGNLCALSRPSRCLSEPEERGGVRIMSPATTPHAYVCPKLGLLWTGPQVHASGNAKALDTEAFRALCYFSFLYNENPCYYLMCTDGCRVKNGALFPLP